MKGFNFKTPNFGAIVAAQPVSTGPMATALGSIGHELAGLVSNAAANQSAKTSMLKFADMMEESDPQSAKVYRSMAEAMPIWTPQSTEGGGARGVGGTGGIGMGGGGTAALMKDQLERMDTERKTQAALRIEQARSSNDAVLAKLKADATLQAIEARTKGSAQLEEAKQQNRSELARVNAELKAADPIRKGQLQLQAAKLDQDYAKIVQTQAGHQIELEKLKEQKRQFDVKDEAGVYDAPKENADAAALRALRPVTEKAITDKTRAMAKLLAEHPEMYPEWKAGMEELGKRTGIKGEDLGANDRRTLIEVEAFRQQYVQDPIGAQIKADAGASGKPGIGAFLPPSLLPQPASMPDSGNTLFPKPGEWVDPNNPDQVNFTP